MDSVGYPKIKLNLKQRKSGLQNCVIDEMLAVVRKKLNAQKIGTKALTEHGDFLFVSTVIRNMLFYPGNGQILIEQT